MRAFDYNNKPGRSQKKACVLSENFEKQIPRVSIITPFYNSQAHFEETFHCVMNQSFEDFEWVIVNDGSTEAGTEEYLKGFAEKDSRIHVLHQENGGQSKAKNYGIRESKGEIIVFLDADDLVEDFWLALLVDALDRHPKAAWSYTDLVGFGAVEYLWAKPFSAGRMTFNNTLVNAAAFRREAILSVSGFPEIAKHYDEDWALYLMLLRRKYHPVHIPVVGFWYRKSENGMQQTVRKDEELRRQSDEYVESLAKSVDISIKCEEYSGQLPKNAFATEYSFKEKLLKIVFQTRSGVSLVKKVYDA